MIAILIAAGFAAGLIDAIAGGGGLITLPALLAVGLPPQAALATNKGQAVFGAVSSFASFARTKGGVDPSRLPFGMVFAFVGSMIGARIVLLIDPQPLKPVVLVLLMMAAGFMAYPRKTTEREAKPWARFALIPIALFMGFYDGFFGPGTGSILIILFVIVFGDSLTYASGNAKSVNLASNLAAFSLFAVKGTILWKLALPMAAANAVGSFIGVKLAVRRGDRFVRVVVLCVVSALVLKMAWGLIN